MTIFHVFIIGEKLYAETLTRKLAENSQINIIGSAPNPSEALPLLIDESADSLILIGVEKPNLNDLDILLKACPNTSLISTNLTDKSVQVYTHQKLDATFSTLVEAITQLSLRRKHGA